MKHGASPWLQSGAIIFYILFSIVASKPAVWFPKLDATFFPWKAWTMFAYGAPAYYDIRAYGTTTGGVYGEIDAKRFMPPTNYFITEGNRLTWGIRTHMQNLKASEDRMELRHRFCKWLLAEYGKSALPSDQLVELELFAVTWNTPVNLSQPPAAQDSLMRCTATP